MNRFTRPAHHALRFTTFFMGIGHGIGDRARMYIEPNSPPLPALHPVLRRHLLHLSHGPINLRTLQRTDLPAWRVLRGQRPEPCTGTGRTDAEVQLFIGIQRSRLQQDNDRLLLGVFDQIDQALVDQLSVRLQSARNRSAELQPFCQGDWGDAARFAHVLQALCPFLFEQVGLHRIYVMLPTDGSAAGLGSVLHAAGFRHEGLLRDHHLGNDGWEDRNLHALTAPTWRSRHSATN
ncbi:GNAT family N-acetyltransferase [Stenotrophomonas sp. NPDC077659]|uniref:GNAT family N-acetyltransferase n=1 Tax=Stenotrophomonas sp. NPDC077659 TaxID=3390694 RepID=UPI003CFFB44B